MPFLVAIVVIERAHLKAEGRNNLNRLFLMRD